MPTLDLAALLQELGGAAQDRLGGRCTPQQRLHLQELTAALAVAAHHAAHLGLEGQPPAGDP